MSKVVIRAENIGKYYRLGQIGSGTLREDLELWWATMRGRSDPLLGGSVSHPPGTVNRDLWALRDVNVEIREGEIVGLIGRNGAGKSTLLKILSRITAPTTGIARLRGRVSSLLEVGTGFHPELSGRDNIYLNGTILGMRKHEINSKLDEIVAFAELERFIDTPVKRYSSGMYVRLGFAVAAHLDPEILIVDEVLAVGDVAFQRKCLGSLGRLSTSGRTVILVSHNLQSIREVCRRGILLQAGRVAADDEIDTVIVKYQQELQSLRFGADAGIGDEVVRRGDGRARFDDITIENGEKRQTSIVRSGETVRFNLEAVIRGDVPELWSSVVFKSAKSGEIVTSVRHPLSLVPVAGGQRRKFAIEFPEFPLRPGEYPLYLWLGSADGVPYDVVDGLVGPLTVRADPVNPDRSFHELAPIGFFSISSRILSQS